MKKKNGADPWCPEPITDQCVDFPGQTFRRNDALIFLAGHLRLRITLHNN